MGLRFGGIGFCRGVLFAREPTMVSGNPQYRKQTRYAERGRDCPRACHRVNVRIEGLMGRR